jgi:putative transposase
MSTPSFASRELCLGELASRARGAEFPTADGLAAANHKRVYLLMKLHGLLLTKHSGQRPGRSHDDGKVVVMRSDLRWCSDGFEFTCWNGEIVRGAFVLDAHDREVIAWRATTGAGSVAQTSAT